MGREDERGLRAVRGPLILVGAGLAAVLVVLSAWPGSDGARALDDGLMLTTSLCGAAAAAGAARRRSGERRLAWALIAVGLAGWAVSQVVWTSRDLVGGQPPWGLGFLGAGYALLPACAVPAIRLLGHDLPARSRPVPRAQFLLDATLLIGAAGIIGWSLGLHDVVTHRTGHGVVPLVYPILDVSLACAVLVTLVPRRGVGRRTVRLTGGGLLMVAAVDVVYTGQQVRGVYHTGHVLDLAWTVGFLLLALAAVTDEPAAARAPGESRRAWIALVLPYMPVLVANAFVVDDGVTNDHVNAPLLSIGIALMSLAFVRQMLTLVENERLFRDLTTRERELRDRSLHDPLTGLANRTLFVERLERALVERRRTGRGVAIAYIDLDDFKIINDTHGHESGDGVLVEVAARLSRHVREMDTVARLGGDEFALILVGDGDATAVVERSLSALTSPVVVGMRRFRVAASAGVVKAESAADSAASLLAHADIAMYSAKAAGKNRVVAIAGADRHLAAQQVRLRELIATPVRSQLSVLYQPVVDLESGRVRGVEALLRWNAPGIGPVSPADFIPMAEAAGSIRTLYEYVLETTVRALRQWSELFPRHRMAAGINVSAAQLGDGELVESTLRALHGSGVSADQLILEITEGALVDDVESAHETISALRLHGVSVAVDDFGTGYSSLRHLGSFEVDVLKIDGGFVGQLSANEKSEQLVRTVIEMGRVLDLQTIAEGIETVDQLIRLRQMGCELAQGFLFARPMPFDELTELMHRGGRYPIAGMLGQVPAQPALTGLAVHD